MIQHTIKFIVLLTVTLTILGCKQKTEEPQKLKIADKIDVFLNELHHENKFNGNVLVYRNEQRVYENSFGYADGSKKKQLTSDYRFGIGSIYKEFPAVAIMKLSEEGKLHMDDTLQKHLPNLPNWSSEITIKNLLQYSSGLPRVDFGNYFSKDKQITEADILNDIRSIQKLEFQPGTDYLYSNNNPFLLIQIIEVVSGQKFINYAQENLFSPFMLKNAVFKQQYPYQDVNAMAMPFNSEYEQDAYKIKAPDLLLCATAEDLYQWTKALHSNKIIKEESVQFLTETAEVKGQEMQAPLGNCVINNGIITEHTHHGSMGNYEGLIQYFSSDNLTIIILTNQKNGNVFEISEKIKEMASTKE